MNTPLPSSSPARSAQASKTRMRGGIGRSGQTSSPVRAGQSRSVGARVRGALAWLEDSWVGDLIGVICLFGMGWMGLVAVGVLQ